MGALKPIFDWDTPSSYDELSGVLQAPTLKKWFASINILNFTLKLEVILRTSNQKYQVIEIKKKFMFVSCIFIS